MGKFLALVTAALLLSLSNTPAKAGGTIPTEVRYKCVAEGIETINSDPAVACRGVLNAAYKGLETFERSYKYQHTVGECGQSPTESWIYRCTFTRNSVCTYTANNPSDIRGTSCGTTVTSPTFIAYVPLGIGCPANATQVGSACECSATTTPSADGKSCTAPCEENAANKTGYFDIGPNAGATPKLTGCSNGCKVYFDGTSPAGSAMVNGVKHWYAKGGYYNGGAKCTPSESEAKEVGPASATKPVDGCAEGQGSATMNGKTVCVDQNTDKPTEESKDKDTTKTEKTEATNPDGSKTTTETTTRTTADGQKEVTVTRTTTRPDGSVTVEKETTDPIGDGNGEGDDNPDEEKGECEKNPSASGCGGEPANIGDIYSAKDKTFSSVFASARDSLMSSPVGTAVGSFFVISNSGACPTWSGTIPFLQTEITMDQACAPWAQNAFFVLRAALFVCAAFFAFRVAIE